MDVTEVLGAAPETAEPKEPTVEPERGVVFPAWLVARLAQLGAQTDRGSEAITTFAKLLPDYPGTPADDKFMWAGAYSAGRFWFLRPDEVRAVQPA